MRGRVAGVLWHRWLYVELLGLQVGGLTLGLLVGFGLSFAASFDENMSLQRILPRKALITVAAGEWLHRQMNPLMSLQVMIAVEALGALIAFEWTIIMRWL